MAGHLPLLDTDGHIHAFPEPLVSPVEPRHRSCRKAQVSRASRGLLEEVTRAPRPRQFTFRQGNQVFLDDRIATNPACSRMPALYLPGATLLSDALDRR